MSSLLELDTVVIKYKGLNASLRDQHRLVLLVTDHTGVGVVRDQVQMGRNLVLLLAPIVVHHLHRVDGQPLVRVDGHTKQARVRVDVPGHVALAQVVQNRRVIQIRQIRHVVALLVLWRILLFHVALFHLQFLFG